MDSETILLLKHLWRDGAYGFLWFTPDKVSRWTQPAGLPETLKLSAKNWYFGVHPCTAIPLTNYHHEPRPPEAVRSQLTVIAAVSCFFADFDAKLYGDSLPRARSALDAAPLPASVITFTGGGYHGYWLLAEPQPATAERARAYLGSLQHRWVALVGGDPGARDLTRVLRVPGSRNYKPAYAPNFPLVTFEKFDLAQQYDLGEIVAVLPPPPPEPERRTVQQHTTGRAPDVWARALRTATRMAASAPAGSKHTELLKAARLLGGYLAGGFGQEDEAIDALEQAMGFSEEVHRIIIDGIQYGMAFPLYE